MPKIIIIGAGLTGLCTAYALEQQGFFDYHILEQDSRPGGLLKSFCDQGFTFDHTGHFLHISEPKFAQFLEQTIGLANMHQHSRKSFIFSHNCFTPYPFQQNLYGLPAPVIIDCILGFVQRNQTIKRPKNFYQWVLKHFGKGLGKHFFFPYNRKLLNLAPRQLMPSWTSRFVPSTTLTELLAGTIERKIYSSVGYNGSFFYPQSGGIEALIKAIVTKLRNPISCNQKVVSVDVSSKRVHCADGSQHQFDLLFSTMPLPQLLKSCTATHCHNWSHIANKLHCNHVINFNLGFNVPAISEKHWIYFPESKFKPYRLGFWHNFAANMVPENSSACYGEISIKQDTGKTAQQRVEHTAIAQTLQFLKLSSQQLQASHTHHLRYAYVVYDAWREKNLAKLHHQLQNQQIYSIGRFGEWKYSSMQEAFLDGQKAAALALERYSLFQQNKCKEVYANNL